GQVFHHSLTRRAVLEQRTQFLGDVLRREVVLEQLGDDLPSSDQVRHAYVRHLEQAASELPRDRGHAVDDDEGNISQCCLDGGGAGGDDGGAREVQGGGSVFDGPNGTVAQLRGDPGRIYGRRYGQYELRRRVADDE